MISKFKRLLQQYELWKKKCPESYAYFKISDRYSLKIALECNDPFAISRTERNDTSFYMKEHEAKALYDHLKDYLEEE